MCKHKWHRARFTVSAEYLRQSLSLPKETAILEVKEIETKWVQIRQLDEDIALGHVFIIPDNDIELTIDHPDLLEWSPGTEVPECFPHFKQQPLVKFMGWYSDDER